MTITVLLFARYREAAGGPAIDVDVPDGATLGDVWEAVQGQVPALAGEAAPLMAIDRAYGARHQVVAAGVEVAFFPPVSGG